jgi:hypothetical protein
MGDDMYLYQFILWFMIFGICGAIGMLLFVLYFTEDAVMRRARAKRARRMHHNHS